MRNSLEPTAGADPAERPSPEIAGEARSNPESLAETLEVHGPEQTLDSSETARADARAPALARGELVDRYVILDRVGAGAMGVVYAAYDPELDRRVALKLLLPAKAEGTGAAQARARLLREAQALAKLTHPNVVAVYDVGTVGERVWVAMQFVHGQTLSEWKRATKAGWREVLALMLQAGEGLAAAHEVGLLHRDFKPDNVMVGDDGVVRVMDFGLARAHRDGPSATPDEQRPAVEPQLGTTRLEAQVTHAGALLGTPAYMAPEQFAGERVEAAADQFSFCVSLWQLLHGERPFAGDSVFALAIATRRGELRSPPPQVGVPRWVRRACAKGLAFEPDQRHPSLRALLELLDRGLARERSRRGRRWALAGVGALAAIAAGLAGQQRYEHQQRVASCEAAGESIDAVWNDARREELRAGLIDTGEPYAAEVVEQIMPWLDGEAREWRAGSVEACTRGEVEGSWDAQTYDKALWCLEDGRIQLSTVVTQLSQADASVVPQAVRAVASLNAMAACTDEAVLATMPAPPPAAQRGQMLAARQSLSEGTYLRVAGKYAESLETARRAREQADALAWPPLQIAALLGEVQSHKLLANNEEAERLAIEGYVLAVGSRSWSEAAALASELVFVVGYQQSRLEEGVVWSKSAQALLALSGDANDLGLAKLRRDLASSRYAAGDYAGAVEGFEAALAIEERALGPEHPTVAQERVNLGTACYGAGDYARAREQLTEAVALHRAALGSHHPDTANALNALATVNRTLGEHDEALENYEAALAALRGSLGPEHPEVAHALSNLASLHRDQGDFDQARALSEESLALLEKHYGPDDQHLGHSLMGLANLNARREAYPEAQALYERIVRLYEANLGPEHPELSKPLNNLGFVLSAQGDHAGGLEHYERALAIREKTLGPEHPRVATTRSGIGELHLEAGELALARDEFEAALAIREQADGPEADRTLGVVASLAQVALEQGRAREASELAQRVVDAWTKAGKSAEQLAPSRWVLARARAQLDGPSPETIALAELAREGYADDAETLAAIDAWLERND
ncbi:serine/threonine kinase family protein [Plesiocystis pacifica SIR-1]|uniref:Serine/threonine kinase family protein n=1 Tax=Plesiocystis pacifica SIR-1 TaxID=391625 RepID=A6G8G1_9BACT|nr:serine/threonine-protein kinase [Plesiocystis pacifica]EDM77871.1 serine/threonine kinase family protein [Plesiocystis pacifica SIR-1]